MWELDYKESWTLKNWCFGTVVLEKTLESPLDCKEIQRVHPKEDQFTVFIGRTSIEAETAVLGPPDARKPERDFQVKKTPWGKKNSNSLQYFCLEKNITEKPGKLHCVGTTRVRYNLITKSPPRKHRLRLQVLLGYQGRARTQSPATVSYTVGFPLFEGHTRTAVGEPRPGRATFLIMVSPLPGK